VDEKAAIFLLKPKTKILDEGNKFTETKHSFFVPLSISHQLKGIRSGGIPASHPSPIMDHHKHESRRLLIFCRWKRPGWHIFADNEKCLGFFTFGLPPAPLCLSGQLKYWTSYFGTRVKNAAAAIDSGGQLWKLKTFEKHDKFQMYHKSYDLCICNFCYSQQD